MKTPVIKNPAVAKLTDWGAIPDCLQGLSRTGGKVLHKNAENKSECGIWRCTPGKWLCEVEHDEFCHFLEGRCTYIHENGEVIEIDGDCIVFFRKGWKGVCHVTQEICKVYMIA